jgi:hypothetical protein
MTIRRWVSADLIKKILEKGAWALRCVTGQSLLRAPGASP